MASVAESLETVKPGWTTLPDDVLFEIVGTTLVEKPPMGVFQAGLATLLVELLGPFARVQALPVDQHHIGLELPGCAGDGAARGDRRPFDVG